MSKILGGTGHRPDKLKGGYSDETFNLLVKVIKEAIIIEEPTEIISGFALGFDLAFASAAIELNIPVTAAVPFDGQESIWPLKSREQYKNLIEKCKKIIVVSNGAYAAWKLHKRNEWIVNNSDKILCLYDGCQSGGTFNCLKYATKQNKDNVNIWNDFQKSFME